MDQHLTATLNGAGDLANFLDDVADSFGEVATKSGAAVAPISRAEEALDDLESQAGETASELREVAASSALVGTSLAALSGAEVDFDGLDVDDGFLDLDPELLNTISQISDADLSKEVKLNVDTDSVDAQLERFKNKKSGPREINISERVYRDFQVPEDFQDDYQDLIDKMRDELEVNINVENIESAIAKIEALDELLDKDRDVDIEGTLDTESIQEAIDDLSEEITVKVDVDGLETATGQIEAFDKLIAKDREIDLDSNIDVEDLKDKIKSIQQKIESEVEIVGLADAITELETLESKIDDIPKEIKIEPEVSSLSKKIQEELSGREIEADIDTINSRISDTVVNQIVQETTFDEEEGPEPMDWYEPESVRRASSIVPNFLQTQRERSSYFANDEEDLFAIGEYLNKLPSEFNIAEGGLLGSFEESADDVKLFTQRLEESRDVADDLIERIPRDISIGRLDEMVEEHRLDQEDLSLDEDSRRIFYEAAAESSNLREVQERLNAMYFAADRAQEKANEIDFGFSSGKSIADTNERLAAMSDRIDIADGKMKSLSRTFDGASRFSTRLDLGPLNVAVGSAMAAIPTLIGTIGALAAALGGLLVVATAVAGVFGLIFAGGLLGMAEGMVGATEDIENRADAIQKIFENLSSALADALAPLQTAENIAFVEDIFEGIIELVGDAAEFASQMTDSFMDAADVVGASFWNMEPQFFAAMEIAMQELLPIFTELIVYLLNSLPRAIAWFTSEGKALLPVLGNLGISVLNFIKHLAEFGTTVLRVIGGPLAMFFDALGLILALFDAIPEPIQEALIAFFALGAGVMAFNMLTVAVSTVIGTLAKLAFTSVGAVAAISKLGAVIKGLHLAYAYGGVAKLASAMFYMATGTTTATVANSTFVLSLKRVAASIWGVIVAVGRYAAVTAAMVAYQLLNGSVTGALTALYMGLTAAISAASAAMGGFMTIGTGGILLIVAAIAYAIARFNALELAVWGVEAALDAVVDTLRRVILGWYKLRDIIPGGPDFTNKIQEMETSIESGHERPEVKDQMGADLGIGQTINNAVSGGGPIGAPSQRDRYSGINVNQTFHGDAVGGNDIQTRTEQAVESALSKERTTETPMSNE